MCRYAEGDPLTVIAGAMIANDGEGERLRIVGQVLDRAGTPVNGALIEIWQATAYCHKESRT